MNETNNTLSENADRKALDKYVVEQTKSIQAHVFLKQLDLMRADQQRMAGLCLTTVLASDLKQHTEDFLHPDELQRLHAYTHQKRADDYLRGRYAVKQAAGVLCPQQPAYRIRVDSGIFRQPLLTCPADPALEASLSHARSVTAAIVYPNAHPMAIDIEDVDVAHGKELRAQISAREQSLINQLGSFSEIQLVTGLWTIKEGLSKVMRCGLTAPISIFEIADCSESGGMLNVQFKHFMQYKALCFPWLDTMCSIVLPRNTRLVQWPELVSGPVG